MTRTRRGPGWAAFAAMAALMLALVVATFFLGRFWKTGSESSSPTITEIQRLGELVVLRVNVADVLEEEDQDFKGVWIVRGDALVAVDMRLAQRLPADMNTKRLAVRLPQPRVIQPRVNFKKSKTYDVSKKAWWNPFVDGQEEFTDQGMIRAQGIVERASSEEEIMGQARDQTELMLDNMYRLVGWDVDVVWQGGSETSETAK